MPRNLKALLWRGGVIDLAVYGVCAAILGHTAAATFDQAPPPAAPVVKARVPAVPRPRPVIDRNIFCSTCGEHPPASLSREPEPTALPLALVAVLFAPPPLGAAASLAVVRDTETHGFRLVAPGDRLRGATVVDVGETRLRLDRQGRGEFLDLDRRRPRSVASICPRSPLNQDCCRIEISASVRSWAGSLPRARDLDSATIAPPVEGAVKRAAALEIGHRRPCAWTANLRRGIGRRRILIPQQSRRESAAGSDAGGAAAAVRTAGRRGWSRCEWRGRRSGSRRTRRTA